MSIENECILLGRAIVTAGVWISYGVSGNDWILTAAVIITLITGVISET